MIWPAIAATSLIAALVMAAVVPRVVVDDPEAPDFRALVTPGWMAATALIALVAAQVLWLLPVHAWWLWVPYLALGTPLIVVDLRTTFLPLSLHRVAAAGMGLGLAGLALTHWPSALAAIAGALAALGFLYLAYRWSRSLGFGDVRLAALVGAVAGQSGAGAWAVALFLGTLLGAIHGVAHAVWSARDPQRPGYYPYGPALWLGPVVGAGLAVIGW